MNQLDGTTDDDQLSETTVIFMPPVARNIPLRYAYCVIGTMLLIAMATTLVTIKFEVAISLKWWWHLALGSTLALGSATLARFKIGLLFGFGLSFYIGFSLAPLIAAAPKPLFLASAGVSAAIFFILAFCCRVCTRDVCFTKAMCCAVTVTVLGITALHLLLAPPPHHLVLVSIAVMLTTTTVITSTSSMAHRGETRYRMLAFSPFIHALRLVSGALALVFHDRNRSHRR